MKKHCVALIGSALILSFSQAWADEAGERAYFETMEGFGRALQILREVAEGGGVERDAPLAGELEELVTQTGRILSEALAARRHEIGPELQAEIEGRAAVLRELAEVVQQRKGAVDPEMIAQLEEHFHQFMEPVGAVLGVRPEPHRAAGHFDVNAYLEFAIEGLGESVTVALVVPHYQVEIEGSEETRRTAIAGASDQVRRIGFEASGELHPSGERWFLHCEGRVEYAETKAEEIDTDAQQERNTEGEAKFNASALLVPGRPAVLVSGGPHKLTVTLRLED
jgi:hypothetical protein